MITKKHKSKTARWDLFLYHVILFVVVHMLLVPIVGVLPLSELGTDSYLHFIQENFWNYGLNLYQNSHVNLISGIWKTILVIHLIVEVIETLFPSKEKKAGQEKLANTVPDKDNEQKQLSVEQNHEKKKDSADPLVVDGSKNKQAISNRAWIYLLVAGLLEIIWATALKMDMLGGPLIITLIISFDLLIKSVNHLGVGIAYAIFTGIGTVGMVIVDVTLFQETMSLVKMLLVCLLILFMIGLRLSSTQEVSQ